MIEVIIQADGFTVTGHAGYGPPGHDIVCAGVSTLVQTFVESAEAFTDAIVKSDLSPGRAIVTWGNPSERTKLLADSFLLGVQGIAQTYPHAVQVAVAPEPVPPGLEHKEE